MALPTIAPTKTIYRGDDTSLLSIQIQNPDETPKDLTGYTYLAQWRLDTEDTEFLALTVDTSDLVHGWIKVSAPAAITAQMTGGGVWDLQQTDPDDKKTTKIVQKTKLKDDVSRP